MDERNMQLALRVVAVMYFLTIIAIQFIVLYRQFALNQSIRDFEDIAIIMTVNSLFLLSALFYFGAIPLQRLRIKTILLAYAAIVVLGGIFIYLKYRVFLKPGLSMEELLDKFLIVCAVSGLIVLFFVLFSFLGKRRLDKELED
jgi:hypothetical protein